jgi:hypothetical protein
MHSHYWKMDFPCVQDYRQGNNVYRQGNVKLISPLAARQEITDRDKVTGKCSIACRKCSAAPNSRHPELLQIYSVRGVTGTTKCTSITTSLRILDLRLVVL